MANNKAYHYIKLFFLDTSKTLKSCNNYLKSGRYNVDYSGKFIYTDTTDNRIPNILSSTFSRIGKSKNNKIDLVKKIFSRLFTFRVLNHNSAMNGTLILITSSKREYKVFDFQSDLVATVFTDYTRYHERKSSLIYFVEHFPIPSIKKFDDKNTTIVEDFITFDNNINNYEIFNFIFDSYLTYFGRIQLTDKDFERFSVSNNDYFSNKISQYFQKNNISEMIFPCILSHGDLWSSNIIKSSNQFYIIDWEHVKKRFFLYDIFIFIFNEAFVKQEFQFLDLYFRGELDVKFSKFFQLFDLKYDSTLREFYFLIFVANIYEERWAINSNQDFIDNLIHLLKRYDIDLNE